MSVPRFEGDYYEIAKQVVDIQRQIELKNLDTDDPHYPDGEIGAEYAAIAHALHDLGAGYAALAAECYRQEYDRLGAKMRETVGRMHNPDRASPVTVEQMAEIAPCLVMGSWGVAASFVAGATGQGVYPQAIRELAGQVMLTEDRMRACQNMTIEFKRVV